MDRVDMNAEIDNFTEMALRLQARPEQLPSLPGVQVAGRSIHKNGKLGGDHIIYLDFAKRYDLEERISTARFQGKAGVADRLQTLTQKAGILIADVAGHSMTDAYQAGMLHQAFLLGVLYELEHKGEVSTELFEHLSVRFYNSASCRKYVTMIYGEINTSGAFRFISAGHPPPIVFSNRYRRLMHIADESIQQYPPLGLMPFEGHIDRIKQPPPALGYKKRYRVNQLQLMGAGDMLLLYTDGLSEHGREGEGYIATRLESVLRENASRSADEIVIVLREDIKAYAPVEDDTSYVVVKRL